MGQARLVRWTPWILAALVLFVFGDVLLFAQNLVASAPDTDAALYFADARAFGFGELRQGHLALWNPYLFSGVPFLGNFQSALLYPPNWLYLFLPLPLAMNLEMALHLWLLGWGMTLWAVYRGLSPTARLLAALLTMFGGPVFLRTYAGHLSLIDAAAWMPFVFLSVELLWAGQRLRGTLLGAGAVAAQALAGHPQTVFITAIATGLYALSGPRDDWSCWKRISLLPVSYVAGALLAAAQLGASAAAGADSIRQGRVPLAFAETYTLAPANLVTLLVPGFFGDNHGLPYWGVWNAWEEAVFLGVFGISLALYGACCALHPFRRRLALLALVLFGLALAPSTPVFPLLYHAVPGFDRFRSECRFAIPGLMFLALLAGMGADTLLQSPRRLVGAALTAFIVAALLGVTAGVIGHGTDGLWATLLRATAATGTASLPPSTDLPPRLVSDTASFATTGCVESAALLAIFGILLLTRIRRPEAAWGIVTVACIEIVCFAMSTRATFDVRAQLSPAEAGFIAAHPDNRRVWQLAGSPDTAMRLHADDIWGYDPSELARYAQFMAWTQGEDPDKAAEGVFFRRSSPLYALLRLRYVFLSGPNRTIQVVTQKNPLPHLLLVSDWRRVGTLTQRLAALSQPTFDPRRTALLESEPHPAPVLGPPAGTVRLVSSDCDSLIIEADTPRPQILLVTDAYARGWRATPLRGSVQSHYDLLPADDILRAVPLTAGHHRLLLEYRPSAFVLGRLVSLVSLLIYLAVVLWTLLGENLIRGLRVRLSRRSVRSGPSVSG